MQTRTPDRVLTHDRVGNRTVTLGMIRVDFGVKRQFLGHFRSGGAGGTAAEHWTQAWDGDAHFPSPSGMCRVTEELGVRRRVLGGLGVGGGVSNPERRQLILTPGELDPRPAEVPAKPETLITLTVEPQSEEALTLLESPIGGGDGLGRGLESTLRLGHVEGFDGGGRGVFVPGQGHDINDPSRPFPIGIQLGLEDLELVETLLGQGNFLG